MNAPLEIGTSPKFSIPSAATIIRRGRSVDVCTYRAIDTDTGQFAMFVQLCSITAPIDSAEECGMWAMFVSLVDMGKFELEAAKQFLAEHPKSFIWSDA